MKKLIAAAVLTLAAASAQAVTITTDNGTQYQVPADKKVLVVDKDVHPRSLVIIEGNVAKTIGSLPKVGEVVDEPEDPNAGCTPEDSLSLGGRPC